MTLPYPLTPRTRLSPPVFWGAVAAVTVVAFVGNGFVTLGAPVFYPDSWGYLEASLIRTPGYPLFLGLIRSADPELAILPTVQFAILAGATALFGFAAARLFASDALGLAAIAAVLWNPFLMDAPKEVLSESLYLGLILLHLALLFLALNTHRWSVLALSSAVLGLAILVRPVAYAFLPLLVLVLPYWRRAWLPAAACLLIPVAAVLLAVAAYNAAVRGTFATQSFAGVNLMYQVVHAVPPRLEGVPETATRDIHDKLAPMRERIENADGVADRFRVETLFYARDGQTALVALADIIRDEAETRFGGAREAEALALNGVSWRIAIATIAAEPGYYLRRVATQMFGAFFVPQAATSDTIVALRVDMVGSPYGWPDADFFDRVMRPLPAWLALLKHLVFGTLLLGLIVGVLLAMADRISSPQWTALGFVALGVFGYLLLVSMLGAVIPRYVWMAWPAECLVAFALAVAGLRRLGVRVP